VIRSRRKRWSEHVKRVGEIRKAYKVWVAKREGIQDLDTDENNHSISMHHTPVQRCSVLHNTIYEPYCLCPVLYILNHTQIFSLTRFGTHWCHPQEVQSYCSFFSTHRNTNLIQTTLEWLRALSVFCAHLGVSWSVSRCLFNHTDVLVCNSFNLMFLQ